MLRQLDMLSVFDLTKQPEPTPYEMHQEMVSAMRNAFQLFYEDAIRFEPYTTGMRFKVRLPDGNLMTVDLEVEETQ